VQLCDWGEKLLGEHELAAAIHPLAADSALRPSCAYIVSNPGKRFRAAVAFHAARYGERPNDPLVKDAAVAIELFHAATLAHDDVVDDDKMRRGKPAIGMHAGNLAASLAGGWLFGRSVELVAAIGDEVAARFGKVAAKVCEGEILEARDLYDSARTRERYLAAIEAKTASLIAFSAWLGATVGGAAPADAERLYGFGEAVGMAFQIADDVLDLIADPELTGKTAGSDLRQGLYTLPVIYALEGDEDLGKTLGRGPDEYELPGLVERVRDAGGIEAALRDCAAWVTRAEESLPEVDPEPEHGERLVTLAQQVIGRVGEMAPS